VVGGLVLFLQWRGGSAGVASDVRCLPVMDAHVIFLRNQMNGGHHKVRKTKGSRREPE
jgi:hypothetical protein